LKVTNATWRRRLNSSFFGSGGYEYYATDSTTIEEVKKIFSLTDISMINTRTVSKVSYFNLSGWYGVSEGDVLAFFDNYNDLKFGVFITLGNLFAAHQWQSLLFTNPMFTSE